MIRRYTCTVSGTGTAATPASDFRAATSALVPAVKWFVFDGRPNAALAPGSMLVWGDVSNAQHATLIADPRVTYLPIEDVNGNVLGPDDLISQIPIAKRDVITTAAEALHVPLGGLKGSDPIRFLMRRFRARLLMRQYLKDLDLTEGLDTLVSAIPVNRRQAINTRLLDSGFNARDAGVVGTDTVRDAIIKMILEREESDRGE